MKEGKQTSTYAMAKMAAILTMVMPPLLLALETYGKTLPANSWLACLMPGLIALGYGVVRMLTANNARETLTRQVEARAKVDEARVLAQTVTARANASTQKSELEDESSLLEDVPDTVSASPDVTRDMLRRLIAEEVGKLATSKIAGRSS